MGPSRWSNCVALKDALIKRKEKEFVLDMGRSWWSKCVALKVAKVMFEREGTAEGIEDTLENEKVLYVYVRGL